MTKTPDPYLRAKDAQDQVIRLQVELDAALTERRAAFQTLREDGRSLQWIANLLGLTKTAVANACQKG